MTAYHHQSVTQIGIPLPVGKVVCVGRNYHDHIKEMASAVPAKPVLFMKPRTAICSISPSISIPTGLGPCHNEIEVALLVKAPITRTTPINLAEQIWGVGLGLDLTLRAIQAECKQNGHPWESAKSFDHSCPVSQFVPLENCSFPLCFSLEVNGDQRQAGTTDAMIFDIEALLIAIQGFFTLEPGDIILTGTPAGVGPLFDGDNIKATLDGHFSVSTKVEAWP